jgi:hypothetical protein
MIATCAAPLCSWAASKLRPVTRSSPRTRHRLCVLRALATRAASRSPSLARIELAYSIAANSAWSANAACQERKFGVDTE